MEYVVLLSVAALLVAVNGQIIINGPKNTAGVSGETLELTCEADLNGDILEWRYFADGTTGSRIYTSGKGLEDSRFEVHVEGNIYRLVIPILSEEFADVYACRLIVEDVDATASVIMLDGFGCEPSWEPPPMAPNPPSVVQDAIMKFSCSVVYAGDLKPKLEWYQEDYPIQTQVTEDETTRTITATANVTAKAELDEVPFECRLMFDYEQGGSYPPEFTDQCSTYYQVTHAPTNIQVYPPPEYEGQVINVQIGNIINCTASGRPEPRIYWYEKETFETQEGADLEITPDRAGEHTWVCKAENEVLGNPRYAEYEVTFNAAGYATDSPYAPDSPAKASVQGWVIAIAVILPIIFITLVLVLGFWCVKKRRAKGSKAEKDGVPPDATEPLTQDPLMQPVPKPRSQSVHSQDSGVLVNPTQGQAAMYPAGSQGRIYKPRAQGQMNRQPSQDPQMYGPGAPGAPQMYRPPSQDRLDHPGSNLQMMRRGSQDHLDRNPNQHSPMYGPAAHGANPNPQMYRPQSRERLDGNPNSPMYRPQSRERLDGNPNSPMYRTPSQDGLAGSGPQPAPRTKLSKSKENLAIQDPKPRPRGSMDQPLTGYGLMGDDAAMKKSRENLTPDGRPKTLPKPKSREDLTRKSLEDLSGSMDEGQRSRPPTLPKPSMQQKLGIQVLPPPPQRHQSVDTEV